MSEKCKCGNTMNLKKIKGRWICIDCIINLLAEEHNENKRMWKHLAIESETKAVVKNENEKLQKELEIKTVECERQTQEHAITINELEDALKLIEGYKKENEILEKTNGDYFDKIEAKTEQQRLDKYVCSAMTGILASGTCLDDCNENLKYALVWAWQGLKAADKALEGEG